MTALTANQNIVSADGSGNPALLPVSQLRGLFAAGANISINASGTISASSPSTATSFNIGALPVATAVASTDLIPIRQSGTDHSVSYASLLNGLTIDAAQPASAVSDSDSFWVAQNSNVMVAQTFGAVWPWVQSKLPSYKLPVVEISTNTALDGTVHPAASP